MPETHVANKVESIESRKPRTLRRKPKREHQIVVVDDRASKVELSADGKTETRTTRAHFWDVRQFMKKKDVKRYFKNMDTLANGGVQERLTPGGKVVAVTMPPDRLANEFLIEQAIGVAAPRQAPSAQQNVVMNFFLPERAGEPVPPKEVLERARRARAGEGLVVPAAFEDVTTHKQLGAYKIPLDQIDQSAQSKPPTREEHDHDEDEEDRDADES